jgi:hypothetical protein
MALALAQHNEQSAQQHAASHARMLRALESALPDPAP